MTQQLDLSAHLMGTAHMPHKALLGFVLQTPKMPVIYVSATDLLHACAGHVL